MQDNRTFEFWWTPTFEYYADAAKAFRRLKRSLLNEALTVGGCLSLVAVGAADSNGLAITFGVATSAYCVLMLWILRTYKLNRYWRQNPALRRPMHGIVDADQGVTHEEQDASSQFRWPAIVRVEETEKQFLLFLDGHNLRSFLQVPKSAVLDEREVEGLRSVLRERVGATAVS